MQNSKFKDLYAPTIVLVAIALFITIALVLANDATAPQIAKIEKKNADTTRAKVLPDAKDEGFKAYEGKLNDNITDVYFAKNGSGAVITSTSKSFGGTMTVMTGIKADGTINSLEVTSHADTPGLGTKAMTPEYLSVYTGKSEFKEAKIKNQKDLNYIVGATISSDGVYSAVKAALTQFKDCGGVQ